MSTHLSSRPPPSAVPTPFSLAAYRAYNDQLEARYPEVRTARAAKRAEAHHREALEHLRRARRGGSERQRLDALEDVVVSLVAASEARGAR